jgi:predicted transcriptional regulator of viral defense system
MTEIDKVLKIADKQEGIVTASNVTDAHISRRALTDAVNMQLLIKIGRGIYSRPEAWEDEWLIAQYRYSKGIYSHDAALFLHGFSNRTPATLTMTFPHGYHIHKSGDVLINLRYSIAEIYLLGIETILSPAGHHIKAYNLERTLCDMVRGNEKSDIQIVNGAIKQYASYKGKNIRRLMKYAKILRAEQKIKNYMEVLL